MTGQVQKPLQEILAMPDTYLLGSNPTVVEYGESWLNTLRKAGSFGNYSMRIYC